MRDKFNLPRRRLGLKQIAHVANNLGNIKRREVQRRRPGQPKELLHDVVQPVQLAVNDYQPARQFLFGFWRNVSQVLFEQLYMNVERTEGIANLVCQPRQQPLLLLRRKLRHVFAKGLRNNGFHGASMKLEVAHDFDQRECHQYKPPDLSLSAKALSTGKMSGSR